MQYLLRFILASYVVFFHVGSYYFPSAGSFAVFGFYTLSGFVISKALNEVYFRKHNPAKDFFINRLWRLYPTYFVTTLIGLFVTIIAPEIAYYWSKSLHIPTSISEWMWAFSNISIVGLHLGIPLSSPIRFSPPSWSTAIEIYFYIFLFFIGAKSLLISQIWLKLSFLLIVCTSLIIIISSNADNTLLSAPELMIYSNVFALSFCFALGAYFYFISNSENARRNPFIGNICLLLAIVVPLVHWRDVFGNELVYMLFHYVESIAIGLFLMHSIDRPLGKTVKLLGDTSYPIFLVHMQIAVVLNYMGFNLIKSDAFSVIIIYLGTLVTSICLVYCVEYPLLNIRKKVRSRK